MIPTIRHLFPAIALVVVSVAQPTVASGQLDGAPPAHFETPWWEELADPALEELLRTAVEANGDLRAAVDRMLQAEATTVRARSALLPTLSIDANANTGPLDGLGFQFGGIPRGSAGSTPLPALYYTGAANVRARYSLSSWGSSYRSLQAARWEAMATRGDEDGVALELIRQVADAYFNAIAAAQETAVISEQLAVSEQLADLAQLRYERGEASALEVLQQRQQLATTRATLPPARTQLRLAQVQLEALTGQVAGAFEFHEEASLPAAPFDSQAPPAAPVSRPDLRSASDRLEAAGARVSEARWSALPNVELSANTGSQFFRSLGTTTQTTWGAALTVSLPILDGFDRSGRVNEARANQRAARSSLEQLGRAAAAEVRTTRIQQEEQQAQLDALRDQLDASERAFEESRRRYLAGLATVLDVLNAMNGMQQAQLGVIRTERTVLTSWIQHRHAMGGPWTRGLRRRLLESS